MAVSPCPTVRAMKHQAPQRHRHPAELTRRHALSERQRREEDGEERLRLYGDRGQAGRHSVGDPEELEQELPGEERQADGHEHGPRNRRPGQHQCGYGGDQEPQRGKLGRREESSPMRVATNANPQMAATSIARAT